MWYYTSSSIRSIDIFPADIKLNYKGKEKFKTLFGGWATLVIFVIMVVYAVFLTNQVINKRGSNTTLSTKIKDLQNNPEEHQPGLGSFKLILGFGDSSREIFYNESYYRIEMYQGINSRVGHLVNYTLTPLETKFWDHQTLERIDDIISEENRITRCPKHDNYTLSGTYISDTVKYLYILVRKCTPLLGDTNWVSDDEIDRRMEGGMFSLTIINSYVDFDDYENVVKTFNDESFYYKLRKGITKEPEILVRKNYVTLNDEFFQMGQTEHKEFYSAENTKTDFDLDPNEYLYARMSIRMEAREDTYERTVFSVFDYTGLIGGVFEIFEVVGGIFVGYFTKNWFMFCILSSLYQVQNKVDDQDHQSSANSNHNDLNEEQKSGNNSNHKEKSDEENEKPDGEPESEKSDNIELHNIGVNLSN